MCVLSASRKLSTSHGSEGSTVTCTSAKQTDIVAASSDRVTKRKHFQDMHLRNVKRNRTLIQFIRENGELTDRAAAKRAQEVGLFSKNTSRGDIESSLTFSWKHRDYWESEKAMISYRVAQNLLVDLNK